MSHVPHDEGAALLEPGGQVAELHSASGDFLRSVRERKCDKLRDARHILCGDDFILEKVQTKW